MKDNLVSFRVAGNSRCGIFGGFVLQLYRSSYAVRSAFMAIATLRVKPCPHLRLLSPKTATIIAEIDYYMPIVAVFGAEIGYYGRKCAQGFPATSNLPH